MEFIDKNIHKNLLAVVMSTVLLVSIGVNVWLYNQLTSINKDTKGLKTEMVSNRKKYNTLSLKIKNSKESLSDVQK